MQETAIVSNKYLHRGDAPFGDSVWEKIDHTVVSSARGQLSGRRLLHVEGPYGLGLKAVPGPDEEIEESGTEDGVSVLASREMPVARIEGGFTLPVRDIAAYESTGLPFDVSRAATAAMACARQEDALLFNGSKALGTEGLLTAKGTGKLKLRSWQQVGTAADDIIKAATALDEAGFHGPYALALAPADYNRLYRRYDQGNQTEMGHVESIVTDGIVKAPAIESGGVLLATGKQFASIVLGQDLMSGFIGPADGDYEFSVSETIALRLRAPESVLVLTR